jgi:hypothetical protein
MSNDQKHLALISMVKELLQVLETADKTKSHLYIDKARKLQRDLRIYLINNSTIIAQPVPAVKKKSPNKFNHNQNWLAQ